MVVGLVMAMVNGALLPAMVIVFGDMTDSFVSDAVHDQMSELPEGTELCFCIHCNVCVNLSFGCILNQWTFRAFQLYCIMFF